jgi:hypothetical protein
MNIHKAITHMARIMECLPDRDTEDSEAWDTIMAVVAESITKRAPNCMSVKVTFRQGSVFSAMSQTYEHITEVHYYYPSPFQVAGWHLNQTLTAPGTRTTWRISIASR